MLANTRWQLISNQGALIIAGTTITLEFDDAGRVAGSGGCNRYGGSYTADADTIAFSQVFSTRRACLDQAQSEQENNYFAMLNTASSYTLTGNQLIISYEGGELLFERHNE